MFMLYLDASGTVDQKDATKHYVLVGAAVHEHTWFALNKRIRGLKAKYAYPGEDFELHVKDFCISISAQDKVPGFDAMNVKDRRDNVLGIWDQKLNAAKTQEERAKPDDPAAKSLWETGSVETVLDWLLAHPPVR